MNSPLPAETFGDLLKYLRKRAHLTQRDLAAAVGYTEAHLSRLENNDRLPDLTTVAALFIPALDLKDDPAMMERLLYLAARARDERTPASVKIQQVTIQHQVEIDFGALEDIPAAPANFVARTALLGQVRAALDRDRCVALCGLAGIGKSALAASLARDFERAPVFWHTFSPGLTTSAEALLRQLALFLFSCGQLQVKPLLEPHRDSSPAPIDQQLVLIRAALANQPALLCFEDAHLLRDNEASLSLLRHLITTTNTHVLMTSRENLLLPVTQVNVTGLDKTEVCTLVERLGLKLGPSELERLLERTGGNPMLLRIAAGQLLGPNVNIPAFLEHLETQPQVASYLLGTMLDGLSQSAHWLASFLSVFRQPVDLYDAALMEMVQSATTPGALAQSIAELQSKYLIEDPRRSALHPLVLDFLYTSLSSDASWRKQLHRLAAEWWEGGVGNMVEASYHWLRAGDIEQAAELISVRSEELFQSGHAKAAVDVVDEALERARLKRGDTTVLRRRLLFARGDLLVGTFRSAEAESSYREALSLAQHLPAVRAEIARNLALILLQRGQSAEALRLCQSARADLSAADVVLLARLGAIESRCHLVLSHYEEAERLANESMTLIGQFAEALPNIADDVRARCERTLGWVNYTRHPEGDEALVHYSRGLESARRAGLRGIECAILSNFATALLERGKVEEARQSYQQAIEGYRALGNLYGEASVLHNLGALSANMEDYKTALVNFNNASEIERLVGDLEGLLSSEGARASLFIAAGKLQEARSVLDRVLIEGRDSNDLWAMGTCLCLSAEVSLLTDELDSARETVKKVLSMPGIESNARIRAWATTDLAMVEAAAGQVSLAHDLVAGEPPDDLGFELTTRWRIVQSVAAIGCNDLPRARVLAQTVLGEAREKNLKQLIHITEGLLAAPPPSLRGSIRLILLGETA